MQVSVAYSLPGSTIIIWKTDCTEWSSMVRILTCYQSHPASHRALSLGLYFFIFINGMSSCVSPNTRIALFANDVKLYNTISFIDYQVALQNDLSALNNWSKPWDIEFNAKKCVVLRVKTRKRHHIAP